jgi:ribonuclease E
MFSPVVQLRSGGYIVLNQAEALVAIDVNSGRATREHHIEDTALKTNLEAADEIARQLRLRDLAGLIVIDFIDMDEKRNNRSVERRLKECLKQDRARIQVGRISHFGLLEMSRQRIRTSVLESSTERCPSCGGSGHVRSVSSLALQVLRALEEQLMRAATHNLIARTRPDVALYVLNQKRAHLRALEERFAITITISADETLAAPQAFAIDRGEQVHTLEAAKALAQQTEAAIAPLEEEDDLEEAAAADEDESEASVADVAAEQQDEGEGGGRRRRRRRRRGRNGGGEAYAQPHRHDEHPHEEAGETDEEFDAEAGGETSAEESATDNGEAVTSNRGEPLQDGERRRRRRGRRGGRRNRMERERNGGPEAHGRDTRETGDGEIGEPSYADAPAPELTAPSAPEPDLTRAVADLDAAHASPPPAQAKSPRRRSTVREPAPAVTASETPQPPPSQPASAAPQPVVTEIGETESTERPRRSGWWSRRFAGG